jgi:hypothetical protein
MRVRFACREETGQHYGFRSECQGGDDTACIRDPASYDDGKWRYRIHDSRCQCHCGDITLGVTTRLRSLCDYDLHAGVGGAVAASCISYTTLYALVRPVRSLEVNCGLSRPAIGPVGCSRLSSFFKTSLNVEQARSICKASSWLTIRASIRALRASISSFGLRPLIASRRT